MNSIMKTFKKEMAADMILTLMKKQHCIPFLQFRTKSPHGFTDER